MREGNEKQKAKVSETKCYPTSKLQERPIWIVGSIRIFGSNQIIVPIAKKYSTIKLINKVIFQINLKDIGYRNVT